MKHTRTAAAVAAASAILLAIGAPASAAPPEIDHFTEHIDQIEQEAIPGWCVDEEGNQIIPFPVRYVEDAHGTFRGVERRGEFYGASTLFVEGSWTNTENGKSFSFVRHGQDKDQTVTTNADGTRTIEILVVGPTQYYDSEGNKMFKDVGRVFVTILVDENDEFIEVLAFDSRGQFDTMGRDFCADLLEFIG